MKTQKIAGMTRDIGKPHNWDESTMGPCGSLPVRDETEFDCNFMVSEWKPTPEDIKKLVAGASIFLGIQGNIHPVVYMAVGEP